MASSFTKTEFGGVLASSYSNAGDHIIEDAFFLGIIWGWWVALLSLMFPSLRSKAATSKENHVSYLLEFHAESQVIKLFRGYAKADERKLLRSLSFGEVKEIRFVDHVATLILNTNESINFPMLRFDNETENEAESYLNAMLKLNKNAVS